MEFIKKYFIGICIVAIGIICLLFFIGVLIICLANGWGYYFFDVLAKSSPAIAGGIAYWIWSRNREKELKQLEYRNDCHKKIIDQRIAAYMDVEEFISRFKLNDFSIPDQPYISFAKKFFYNIDGENAENCRANEQYDLDKHELVSRNNFWFSKELMGNVNSLVFTINKVILKTTNEDIVNAARYKHGEISKRITYIEKIIARDFLELCDVDKFLKSKQ